jgi:TonB family protein
MVIASFWLSSVSRIRIEKSSRKEWELVYQFDIHQEKPQRSVPQPDWSAVLGEGALTKKKQPRIAPPEPFSNSALPSDAPGFHDFEDSMAAIQPLEKQPLSRDTSTGKYQISIPVLETKSNIESKFTKYSLSIREKILQRAYAYKEDARLQGEVHLTFVVLANGALKDVRIEDQKSTRSYRLRQIGLRSVKEASPFPPFPKDMNYQEIPFSVIIVAE